MFYHIKNLQSTKTTKLPWKERREFYHIKNLQSTKTKVAVSFSGGKFYHIKNLQSTKTWFNWVQDGKKFYHIKNLQSTKTQRLKLSHAFCFITLRIYKVLKLRHMYKYAVKVLSH